MKSPGDDLHALHREALFNGELQQWSIGSEFYEFHDIALTLMRRVSLANFVPELINLDTF